MPNRSPLDDLFAQMHNMPGYGWTDVNDDTERERTSKNKNKMWQLTVYNGDNLVLEHKQNDFTKVLQFAVNSLVELNRMNAKDYRLALCDKEGNVYFYAIGEATQIVGLRKKGSEL